MRRLIGITLLILGTTLAAVHGLPSHRKIVLPKILTYPVTTLEFSSKAPAAVRVKFDNPSWAASVSEVHWVTTGGGTYFKLTCEASSAACLQATKGTGKYTYALMPVTAPAPRRYGHYSFTWDVNPPGDLLLDGVIITPPTVPEIDPVTSVAALALIAGAVLVIRGRRRK